MNDRGDDIIFDNIITLYYAIYHNVGYIQKVHFRRNTILL